MAAKRLDLRLEDISGLTMMNQRLGFHPRGGASSFCLAFRLLILAWLLQFLPQGRSGAFLPLKEGVESFKHLRKASTTSLQRDGRAFFLNPYTPWDCHICRPHWAPLAPPLAVSRQSYGSPMGRRLQVLRWCVFECFAAVLC